MTRKAALALALAALPSIAQAEPVPGGVREAAGDYSVTVVALTPSILRVRFTRTGDTSRDEPSWAVLPETRAKRAPVTATATGFDTSALSVSLSPDDLHLTIRSRDGTVLVDDIGAGLSRAADGFELRKVMPAGTTVLGMGDKTGGLDRAGKTFVNWNTDAFGFGTATDPIYKSIPYYVALSGGTAYGLLLDNSFRSTFDFGHRREGEIAISAEGGSADYYVIAGPSLAEVTRGYAALTGTAPMMPRWALGYQQSRYSYMSSTEVRDLVARFAAERFPLDAVWLDIDFQDRNRPFTVDRKTFPDFEPLIGELAAKGVHTIPIVDLHIASAPNQGYAPYDQGMAGKQFLTNPDGSTYVAPVWPGPAVFPDFTRAETRQWWGTLIKPLSDAGVAGIWNDMNEPAIFDTPTKTMPLDTRHRIEGEGRAPRTATHAEVHNIYGMENSRATYEGLLKLRPDVRPFVMTRASFAGGHRFAVTWTGDNSSSWDHLKLAVAQTINLGLSGFAWTGTDVGGFTGGPSPELMTRWMEYAAFLPIFRNHSAKGTPRAEPWVDGPGHLAIRRRYVEERYRLLPYLSAVAAEVSRTGDPFVRPIGYDDSKGAKDCDPSMSFTVGRDLLVSGSAKPESPEPYNACLPDGGWYDYWTGKPVDRSKPLAITPTLETLPVFVRAGAIVPRQPLVQHSNDQPNGPLELHVYPGPDCGGELYDDDGISVHGPTRRQSVRCAAEADGATAVTFAKPVGRYAPWWKRVAIIVHDTNGERRQEIAIPKRAQTVHIPVR